MYHSICNKSTKGGKNYYSTIITKKRFEEQIQYLLKENYQVITLDQVHDLLVSNKSKSHGDVKHNKKYVSITFDDGYRNVYLNGFPILKGNQISATIFLPTSYIGKTEPIKFNGYECLTWKDIESMDREGIDFGSHTMTHPLLENMNEREIQREIQLSKKNIEKKLCKIIDKFSYPYAFPDNNKEFISFFKRKLIECGYKIGVTTRLGTNTEKENAFVLKRLPINDADDLNFFKAKLTGGYDWLYLFQYLYKISKNKRTKF